MASFLSAGDIDAKFDARCYASQWRRMLNSKDGTSLQACEALGLSKSLGEEVDPFLRPRWIEGSLLDVNFSQ